MIDEFLSSWFLSQSSITALIGDRWYPFQGIQNEDYPRIVYHRTDGKSIKTLTKPLALQRSEYIIEVQSKSYLEADAISDMLIGNRETGDNRLDGYSGTVGTIQIQGAHLDRFYGLVDSPVDAGEVPIYRLCHDFVFWSKRV